jgi:hypothetical protein
MLQAEKEVNGEYDHVHLLTNKYHRGHRCPCMMACLMRR